MRRRMRFEGFLGTREGDGEGEWESSLDHLSWDGF